MFKKQFTSEIKELDPVQGYVEAYANAYNNVDSADDISAFGSFNKTVSENMKKLRVYKNHDTRILVGVPKMIDVNDPFGLKTGTQFNMNTDDGKNMFWDVKLITDNKQDADLSIGYEVMRRDTKDKRIITEYKLWEYSFLSSWACNPLATATGVKSITETMNYLQQMYNLPYSDQRLIQVEKILKSLDSAPSDDTHLNEPIKPKSIYSLINSK